MKFLRSTSISLFVSSLVSVSAYAGVTHSLQHTAVTTQPGSYEARGQADFILNHGGGINVSGHFRTGIIEDMLDVEGFIGTGKTDFKIGALTQFNLLPDVPGQIGLAFLSGVSFINDDYGTNGKNATITALSFAALGSKRFDVSFGKVSPYAGFQVEMLFKDGPNVYPLTGIAGAEWAFTDTLPWVFFSELDFEIHDSVFLVAAGGAYRF